MTDRPHRLHMVLVSRATCVLAIAGLLLAPATAVARPVDFDRAAKGPRWPAPIDPRTWTVPENMTWAT